MDIQPPLNEHENPMWSFGATLIWGIVVAFFIVVVQTIVFISYAKIVVGGISKEIIPRIEHDGTALSLVTFATFIFCVPIICGIIKLKKKSNITKYLAIKKISKDQIKYWLFVVIVLIVFSDSLTYFIGRPIVPEFMTAAYNSTNQPWLLFLALIFAAPIFEELFFRGFLLSGFSSTFVGPIGAIIITSLAWASIHRQYDLYGIATIFITGLVLGVARLKTNSVLITIIMHSTMNLVATIETVIYAAR